MTHRPDPPANGRGFTLVEVMVAMVIGMIGIIIMMQVFATAEGQRRTTTGTGDAQVGGSMSLHELQRDIRQSGYGLNSMSLLNCSLALGAPSNATLPAFAPVIINPLKPDGTSLLPAGDANTDTLLVAFGNGNGSPEGESITGPTVGLPGLLLNVGTPANFHVGDLVIAGPGPGQTCAPPPAAPLTLNTVVAVAADSISVSAPATGAIGGLLFNLGAAPIIRAYAVSRGNLTVCDYMGYNNENPKKWVALNDCGNAANVGDASIWKPIASNIVSLRAQFGIDTTKPMDGAVDIWDVLRNDDQAPIKDFPAIFPPAAPRACKWVRAPVVRIAVVARDVQRAQGGATYDPEKDIPPPPGSVPIPTWEGGAVAANNPVPAPFDLTKTRDDTNDWKNYRYRAFETAVPIRNLIWMQKECP